MSGSTLRGVRSALAGGACVAMAVAVSVACALETRAAEAARPQPVPAADEAAFNYPAPPAEGARVYFPVAVDGKAACAVIHPSRANPDEMRAAFMLKTYLTLATSAEIPLLRERESPPPGVAAIHVGGTRAAVRVPLNLPDLRYGEATLPNINGYLVKTLDRQTLVIRGAQPAGTMLGVVGFLKRYVGVKRYWPGSPGGLGDVAPTRPTLHIPQVEWRDWPYFVSRTMSLVDFVGPEVEERFLPYLRNGFSSWLRLNYTIPTNENYYRLLPAKEYGMTHPEYFPLINGVRRVPPADDRGGGWQPCVSNPEVAPIMAQGIIAHFRANPNAIAMNLAVNDGLGDCMCANCRAMDSPGADPVTRKGLGDRYMRFNNRVCEIVAREFPDRIIAFLSYGGLIEPPATVRLHPMLMPAIVAGMQHNTFQRWDDWKALGATHMGIYLYHDDLGFLLPKLDVHLSAKRIRYMVASGLVRSFYQEFVGIWPLDGMVGHVEAELAWDPRRDPDDILNEYYTLFFGPAAQPMKQFYDALEAGYERYLDQEGLPHPAGEDLCPMLERRSMTQFKVLRPEESDRALQALDAAAAAAKGNDLVARRVDVVRQLFGFADLGVRQYWLAQEMATAPIRSLAEAEAAVEQARRLVSLSRSFGEYKRDVMEHAPASLYAKHLRDPFYAIITPDSVMSDDWLALASRLHQTGDYLRGELGAGAAGDWLAKRLEGEQDPWMRVALRNAEAIARGEALENLVEDSSFERRGARLTPSGRSDMSGSATLDGVSFFVSGGTAAHAELTGQEAHSGNYSVLLGDTQSASLVQSVDVKGGECLRMTAWVKHNDVPGGIYTVQTVARGEGRASERTVAPIPWKPGVWQEHTIEVFPPAGATHVDFLVSVLLQPTGARLWIDDLFIGKYPR